MDKQAQDRLWSELSEETQQEYREKYKFHLADSKRDPKDNFGGGYDLTVLRSETIVDELVNMFGIHNLNPKQIKTWEDVERAEGGKISVDSKVINPNGRAWGLNLKFHNKAEATLKLAILIDLGYGGMVSEEEWKDDNILKYYIKNNPHKSKPSIHCTYHADEKRFISFHTQQQAEEFMSHESNRKLVEQYYMM